MVFAAFGQGTHCESHRSKSLGESIHNCHENLKLQVIFAEKYMHTRILQMVCRRAPLWTVLRSQPKALIDKNHISKSQGQMETPLRRPAKGRERVPG